MRGSVFKRCTRCGASIRERRCPKCGQESYTWSYVVDVGRDGRGHRHQRKRGGFTSKREAERALREVLVALDRAAFVEPSRLTVGDFLRDEWLPSISGRVKPNTYRDRRLCVENYIVPRIGSVALQEVNATPINRL